MGNKFKPTVSDEYAEKLQQWQDNVYRGLKQQSTQVIDFLGLALTIPPKVHPVNPMSDLLGNSVLREVKETDIVLDMGTGCGVNAILAASKSNKVIAVDINPEAIKTAEENAQQNGAGKILFRISDVFSEIKENFDLIIFDPPFRWFTPRDVYEISTTDEGYKSLRTFFSEVNDHLNPDGRILLCFGSSGDLGYLYQLIEKHRFEKEVIAQRNLEKEGIRMDYFTFRLTRK
jgi:release factor glutamine methyltransferase